MGSKKMGSRIHDKRKEYHLSMEELGEKLGVGKGSISRWENGAVENIKRSHIAQMAKIFDCDPAWLMGLDCAEDVKVTYHSSDADCEPVTATVDIQPIIGKSAEMAQRALLYQAALNVLPENIEVAIKLLKSLS